ncbi:MAG: TolC family protein [Candidatus Omnitrophica bacterium]|nr:TolC family protein [Candidatus Omnitrophota bacterium]
MKNLFFICIAFGLVFYQAFCPASSQEEAKPLSLELSLSRVSELALANNLDIQIAKFDAYISRYDLDRQESIFDTFVNMQAGYSDNQSRSSSAFLGSKSLENSYQLSLEKKFPSGTEVSVEGTHTRTWTDSDFTSVNPAVEGSAKVSLSQALGKNFFGLIDRLTIKITKLDIESTQWLSLESIEKALADTQKAYWQLVLKEEELKIKKDMLEEAQDLFRVYKDKGSMGLAEDPDILASEANKRIRESDVLTAQLERETAKNQLLFLLNTDDTAINVIGQDCLDTSVSKVDLYSQVSQAVNSRRDYKAAKNSVLSKDMDLKIKKNSLWPEIDLEASYARNGLSTRYKQAWEDVSQEDNPVYFFGIKIGMPLENREARAEFKQANLKKEKALLTLKKTERLILKELNNQITLVNTLAQQVKAFREVAGLQEKKLDAEKKRFAQGRSNSDVIIRYSEDLLAAQLNLARTLFSYRLSLIDLEVAKGTLLDKYWKGSL